MDFRLGPAYRYAADLAAAGASPRVCIVATAVGDSAEWLTAFYT
jgi:thiamine monophosphate kinase